MNKIACIYFEGNDSKVALFTKENNKLILIKAESQDTSLVFAENQTSTASKSGGNGKPKETVNYDFIAEESSGFNRNYLQKLNEFFYGQEIYKCQFVPVLGEPAIYFQKMNDQKDVANLNVNAKGKIDNTIGYVKLYDSSTLAVYPSGKSNYLQALDSLAKMNNRRFLKIPSVKSAEISLASYIAGKKKFESLENTLILYTGKEYSKLIFLTGDKLHHISPTLSVGKNSFNAHNVIVSKILLEMEHAGFSKLDNIIVCGEDETEEFLSIITEAYPQSKVETLKFDDIEINNIDSFSTLGSFIVPISVAEEFYNEQNKKFTGINLLPNYIKEEQKPFHFGWQSYLMMALIFASAFYLSFRIVANKEKMKNMKSEINQLHLIEAQNQETVNKIKSYEARIKNVDQTKATLNNLSSGTGILSDAVKKVADFTDSKRNLWISSINLSADKSWQVSGYTLSRIVVRELSDSYKQSLLQNIVYEPLRDYRAFKFLIDSGKHNMVKGGNKKR